MEEHAVREEDGDIDPEEVEVFAKLAWMGDGRATLERREDRPGVEARSETRHVEVSGGNVLKGFERLSPRQLAVGREICRSLVYMDVEVDHEQLVERAGAPVLGEDVWRFG